MNEPLRLMCIMAHPDDESFGAGGILAKYAAEGIVATYLVTATRGEQGWFGATEAYPGPDALGKMREDELRAAADVLNLREVKFLDYCDGELDQSDSGEVIHKLVAYLRQIKPQVVVTFDPNGAYGHPDHIAISQLTTAAIVAAAGDNYHNGQRLATHQVSKLYYMVETQEKVDTYQAAFGDLVMNIDNVERRAVGWHDWAITTRIDTQTYWQQVWEAIFCHQTQLPGYHSLKNLPEAKQRDLWGTQSFYRAFSLVNGGRQLERDLFAGLR